MTPINQILQGQQTVSSSSGSLPQSQGQQGQQAGNQPAQQPSSSPDLEKLAAIRDELLRMRASSPAMAPYIDQAIQSLVDGLSSTMQEQQQGQGQSGSMQGQGDSSAQPSSYGQLPY